MLQKVIDTFGSLFIIMLFVISGALFTGLVGFWYAVQDEAQFLARSQGKYGGYTQEANNELVTFINDRRLDRGRLRVVVSSPGAPSPWGTPVHATIEYSFPFQVGQLISFDVPIKGAGRSVSTYLPGAYSVAYMHPSW